MSVAVTMPSLRSVAISGTGTLTVEVLRAKRLLVSLTGSGLVRASGRVDRLDASLGGTGDLELGQLVAANVHVIVAGTGRIGVVATRAFEASVTGAGSIVYSGNPRQIMRSVTGTGSIVPRDAGRRGRVVPSDSIRRFMPDSPRRPPTARS